MISNEFTFGSLFSGIGGMDLGLERAGMVCRWQVEINTFCQMILTKHWPDVPKYADIRTVGGSNLEKVDLVAGSFPCQPYSIAGKRRGKEDDRYLWPDMLRVVHELRSPWVFAENVPGILSINSGMVIEEVLSDLENEGYETMPPFIIPACGVDAGHKRDRVWILAYTDDSKYKYKIETGNRETHKVQEFDRKKYNTSGGFSRTSTIWQTGNGYTGTIPNADKQHGNRGGLHPSEISQLEKAQILKCRGWFPEPELGRVANGIPNRLDRLKSLGNAVVPQIVEVIGRAILDIR